MGQVTFPNALYKALTPLDLHRRTEAGTLHLYLTLIIVNNILVYLATSSILIRHLVIYLVFYVLVLNNVKVTFIC